jgi:hypothetical protein
VRRQLFFPLSGFVLLPVLCGLTIRADELPKSLSSKADKKATCSKHGTSVEFLSSPTAAARQAKKDEKLVFILHVSGHFEDPKLT